MENILYKETIISTGLFKNTQIQITLYADRLEIEYSKAMSSKELWEIQSHISYVKKKSFIITGLPTIIGLSGR